MRYVLCYCCGRQRAVERIKKGTRLICRNCGARGPRVINRRHVKWWMDVGERDGDDADEARHRLMGWLRWWAEHKRYKPGWAAVRFREMFGRRPNGEAKSEPTPPGPGLMDRIKRDNAAYAKQMRAAEKLISMTRNAERAESDLMSAEDWDAL